MALVGTSVCEETNPTFHNQVSRENILSHLHKKLRKDFLMQLSDSVNHIKSDSCLLNWM